MSCVRFLGGVASAFSKVRLTMLSCACQSLPKHVKVWIYCAVLLRAFASCQLDLFMSEEQMKSSLSEYSNCIIPNCRLYLIFSRFFMWTLARQVLASARDFNGCFRFLLDLDFGTKVYFIEKDDVASILQNPIAFSNLMNTLPQSVTEAQFTWQSHPLVSRPFFILFTGWLCYEIIGYRRLNLIFINDFR